MYRGILQTVPTSYGVFRKHRWQNNNIKDNSMSLLVDTVKEITRKDICPKDLTHNFESLVDLLEEMGLKETQQNNTISYTYNEEVWISFIFDLSYHSILDIELPIFKNLLKLNNPLYCFVVSYRMLREHCINTHEQGMALESLGFLLNAYMSYKTNYKFKSKRILWEI